MGNATMLHIIAAGHAMTHAKKREGWLCQCLACKFTKEYKIPVRNEDGTIREATHAEFLLKCMQEQGMETHIT